MLTPARHAHTITTQPNILVLVQGKIGAQAHWAYVCMLPTQAEMFYADRKNGRLNLDDYGTVLEHGEGEAPDSETRARMKEIYGFRDDYEDALRRLAANV